MMVSICCKSYNRRVMICDAIEGFLSQKTNFPYEIIIVDDGSSDGTQDVIKKYAADFPDVIRPVFLPENSYTKKGIAVVDDLYAPARGKYIAECDDDDYWTDPLKLQKQVDFMEANQEYAICYHDFRFYWSALDRYDPPSKEKPRDYTAEELISYSGTGYTIHPSTRMWRNVYSETTRKDFEMCWDDYSLNVMMGLYGGCKFIEGILPSIYRRHNGNIWGGLSTGQKRQFHADINKRLYDFMVGKGIERHIEARRKFLS